MLKPGKRTRQPNKQRPGKARLSVLISLAFWIVVLVVLVTAIVLRHRLQN